MQAKNCSENVYAVVQPLLSSGRDQSSIEFVMYTYHYWSGM